MKCCDFELIRTTTTTTEKRQRIFDIFIGPEETLTTMNLAINFRAFLRSQYNFIRITLDSNFKKKNPPQILRFHKCVLRVRLPLSIWKLQGKSKNDLPNYSPRSENLQNNKRVHYKSEVFDTWFFFIVKLITQYISRVIFVW